MAVPSVLRLSVTPHAVLEPQEPSPYHVAIEGRNTIVVTDGDGAEARADQARSSITMACSTASPSGASSLSQQRKNSSYSRQSTASIISTDTSFVYVPCRSR